MFLIILFVLLPLVFIVGGILYFNVYLRKQIIKDTSTKPSIDLAYVEAEKTKRDDEDLGSNVID